MKKSEISFAIAAICALVVFFVINCVMNTASDPHAAWVVCLSAFAGMALLSYGIVFVTLSIWEVVAKKNYEKTMKKLSDAKERFSDKLIDRISDFLVE